MHLTFIFNSGIVLMIRMFKKSIIKILLQKQHMFYFINKDHFDEKIYYLLAFFAYKYIIQNYNKSNY